MRRMLHKWLLSTFFVLIASGMVAQTKLMSTDFSQGLPLSWGQSPANPLHGWTTGATGVGTLVPQTSSAYAMLNSPELQGAVKLITTRLDISSLQNPVLSYWFAQPAATDGNYDHLKVYYRTTLTGAWTLLKSENGAVPFWTHRVIALDQLGATSIQIAFEYNYGSGIGVALDNIYIDDESPCTPPAGLNARNIRANSASLFWSGASVTDYYDLKVSTTPMVDMTATADVYDNMVFVPPYALSGLTATSTYYFYLRAHCDGGDISDWSDQGTFTTACDAVSLPYEEDFTNCVGSSCWN